MLICLPAINMFYRSWIQPSSLTITECFGDSHWHLFVEARKKHNENICLETNKLVLRLDKLVNPDDGDDQRSGLDKSLVEWTQDDLVKLCPFCAKSFTIARRRHHCRPCGAVLCNACSHFLEYRDACKLVRPAKLYTDPYDRIEDRLRAKGDEDKPKIRTCEDCKRLLDKRIRSIDDYYCQPEFSELYDKLHSTMIEADKLMLSYESMINDKRQPTPELKQKIQELKHSVASISSKLAKMSERESGKQAYLFSVITQSVSYWFKETTEDKRARVEGTRSERQPSGWVPEQPASSLKVDESEDPLLIQIKNLEEYIRQARLADRYEEVSSLEESKRDLEIEYLIQKDLRVEEEEGEEEEGRAGDDDHAMSSHNNMGSPP